MAALLVFAAAGQAGAQWVQPRVKITPAQAGAKPPPASLEPDAVFVGDCLGLRSRVAGARFEPVASIRLLAATPWYVSLESIARDKAGELGANCLEKRRSWGFTYPIGVSYRAYRFTRFHSFITSSAWVPISRAELANAVPPVDGSGVGPAPSDAASPSSGPDTPLWTSGPFVFAFEIGLDTAKLPPAVWQDVQEDFKPTLPPADFARLLEARARGEKVLIDFKHERVRILAGG